jgi:hypothetical protein
MGQPTEKIADKESYHLLDALRYIGSYLFGDWGDWGEVAQVEPIKSRWVE